MKLPTLSLVVVSAAIAITSVAASPIRLEIAVPATEASPFRLGHAAAPANANVLSVVVTGSSMNATGHHHIMTGEKHGPCPMRMKAKAIQISNWFRQQLGLPLIEVTHGRMRHHHHHSNPSILPIEEIHILPIAPHAAPAVGFADGPANTPIRFHHKRPQSFLGRVHKSLMVLGPWEGRAVAFVLGCGIGSLLRMIWVLAIIAYRSFSREESSEPELLFEIAHETLPAPPQYVDEKTTVSEEEKK